MFGISMSSISMIVGLISLGIVCLAAFFNYTRNFDVSKRIRRIEKGMEDINNEIFKIHKWIKDSELENQLSTTALHNKIKTESIDVVNNALVNVYRQVEILEAQVNKERDYIEEKIVSIEEKIREFGYFSGSSATNIDEKRIIGMFRDGWSIDAIAKEMRLSKGEIEFTLKLADIKE
ncbi:MULTISPECIES: hypothetical protein [Helicobacter]|uniref:Uncharacterized protein n=5 Tax=Helicobacter typhlonius TaxID=76936 RepID=A0A099UDI2_9HELI|nr:MULTISPECIES: hypothetical protein [Helicobacter]TLD78596.1 hypothetical protein LS75_004565 [Helicobacter typhlonius]TLD89348.1 hypothetical protein LS67_002590 [Helicobacter sp. MIT 03-1616]CUU40158.1 FIG00711163: Hypothetical protein [Helicobacter typhlonius]HCD73284.1 hypothetical protein [Helicobacter sp.]